MEKSGESQDTKTILLRLIDQNPGIRYRELLRLTRLANGVLAYHLSALEKSEGMKVDRRPGMTRYFSTSVSDKESDVLRNVRRESIRKILLFLLDHDLCTFNEIVDYMHKAPATISSHLTRLKKEGIITVRYGEYHLYRLADKELISDVLSKYKSSFADKVVDNYVEIVEEL